MDRLKGKVAVITGGNSGVGEATAKLFAKEGAVVVITARREAALTKVAEEIKAAGGEAFAVSTDISKPEDPERLMELVLKKYGKIDILINNAGILETGLKPIDRFLDEDLDRIVETNQKGTMRCMRAAARRMQSGASIVNVASDTALWGAPRLMAYVASKGAVIAMTRSMARELGEKRIRINAIAPGLTRVEATEYVPAERHQLYENGRALSGAQQPEDVTGSVVWLLSDLSRFITGQLIPVNGGFVFN
jgi:NAD(P)-dependent dehydrogenase (short-subunit alcohol dehydrogenase family)